MLRAELVRRRKVSEIASVVAILIVRLDKLLKLIWPNIAQQEGDLLGGRNLKALTLLNGRNVICCIQHAVGRARVQPCESASKLYGAKLSAQKGRLVADMVRGQKVDRALNILAFTPKKGAVIIKKVLESAIANAEHNNGADIDELKITRIVVEKGPVLKRFHARAKGRGNRVLKHTCHVFLTVGDGRN